MQAPREFSFDPAKNERNMRHRGFGFELAQVFDFATALVAIDDRKDYGEIRQVATGFVNGRLHVLVFTKRGSACHVISLRKANKREVKFYAEETSRLE